MKTPEQISKYICIVPLEFTGNLEKETIPMKEKNLNKMQNNRLNFE